MLADITPVILTYNEAANIGRCLERLSWAKRIIVVDSGSNDATVEICGCFPNVILQSRVFDCHANQWNFAVHETHIDTDWVLALDADYMVGKKFVDEVASLRPEESITGYRAAFDYALIGKRLRCGIYPPVVVLFRRCRGRYMQDGHTQRLEIDGKIPLVKARIVHDDRKTPKRWVQSQIAYAQLEAERLYALKMSRSLRDRLRTTVPVSWFLMPIYLLLVRRGILDGRAGWSYALQRCIAEAMISLFYFHRVSLANLKT